MNRDNNGDDAIVVIKDQPGENYRWIRNTGKSSSELQNFFFFFFLTWERVKSEISCSKWIRESSSDFTKKKLRW